MQLTSTAFEDAGRIPDKYTCDGDRFLSPPLSITGVPEGTQALALIMDDPDVPKELREDGLFTHWILFNIPADTSLIPQGAGVGTPGSNTRGEPRYTGPCPPPDHEPTTHRYLFKLYALDSTLDLPVGAPKEDLEAALNGHILEIAELTGTYSRG
jgi:Raf kinase inhibitor-like YbhB/YbcL family protein